MYNAVQHVQQNFFKNLTGLNIKKAAVYAASSNLICNFLGAQLSKTRLPSDIVKRK